MTSQPIPALPTSEPGADVRELDRSLIHGIAWTGGAKWASQLLTWASTLIVARLLTPEDYGLVGMAWVYLGVITLLSEFGLGTTVVTLRDLGESRSEEHTSELQSRLHLVCRLLLEKKKIQSIRNTGSYAHSRTTPHH